MAGWCFGWIMYQLPTRTRKTTLKNLSACFPSKTTRELAILARNSMQHTARMALESGKCWFLPVEKSLKMIIDIEGEGLLKEARENVNGSIILMPHLGNWEITGLYLGEFMPTTFLYQPPKVSRFDKMIKSARSRGQMSLAPTNTKGVAILLKAIKKGEAVGILPDQEPGLESGEFAPFFGVSALTMTLASGLVSRTEAKVISAFAIRLPKGKGFKLIIQDVDPLVFDPDLKKSVEGVNRSVEQCVKKAMDQYQWEYKRFKRRQDGHRFYE